MFELHVILYAFCSPYYSLWFSICMCAISSKLFMSFVDPNRIKIEFMVNFCLTQLVSGKSKNGNFWIHFQWEILLNWILLTVLQDEVGLN